MKEAMLRGCQKRTVTRAGKEARVGVREDSRNRYAVASQHGPLLLFCALRTSPGWWFVREKVGHSAARLLACRLTRYAVETEIKDNARSKAGVCAEDLLANFAVKLPACTLECAILDVSTGHIPRKVAEDGQ
jgi:hypothetical protein